MRANEMWLTEIKNLLQAYEPLTLPRGNLTPSAVLAPLSIEEGSLILTFVERTHNVNHPGQLSFPGGHFEDSDDSLLHTAVRETGEEIGVPSSTVLPLGRLSDQITPSGYWIRPFVAGIPTGLATVADPHEIASLLTIPILDLAPHHSDPPMYRWNGNVIWGVTARMVNELLGILF